MDRRWMVVAAIAATAVAIAIALLAWPRGGPAEETADAIAVPARGGVAAVVKADGRPVWVIHHSDGRISVLDAFSSHVPFGIHKPTWWCTTSRVIEDPFHGSVYDEFGRRIFGPAPVGLGAYRYEVRDGRHIVIGDPEPRDRGQGAPATELVGCGSDDALTHDFDSLPAATSPADAASHADGWLRLQGTLVPVRAQDAGLLCPDPEPGGECAHIALPGMARLEDSPGELARALRNTWTDTEWLVHVVDGVIVEISYVIPPDQ